MYFVVGLSKTLGKHDSIWVIIYKLMKLNHFIQVKVDYNAMQLANIYVTKIVRLHGVTNSIISNRDMIYSFKFLDRFHEELVTNLTLSTTFHSSY